MTNNEMPTGPALTEADERLISPPDRRRSRRRIWTTALGGAVVVAGSALAIFAGPAGADGATTPTPVLPPAAMCAIPDPGTDVVSPGCTDMLTAPADVPTDTVPDGGLVACPGTPAPGYPVPATIPR